MNSLEDAIALAVDAHRGQRDKAGRPYILHPLRVMLHCGEEIDMVAAVLHDVLEDTPTTVSGLREAGFSEEVLAALDCLAMRRRESYGQFIARAARNPVARRVKMADLADNMDVRRLSRITPRDARRLGKYLLAWRRLQLRGRVTGRALDDGGSRHA